MKKKLMYILSIVLLLFCLNIVVPVKADSGWDSSYDSSSSSDIDGDLDPLSFVIGFTIIITIAVIYMVYEKIKNKINPNEYFPKTNLFNDMSIFEENAIKVIKIYDSSIDISDISSLKIQLKELFNKLLFNINQNNKKEIKKLVNFKIKYILLLNLKSIAKYQIDEFKIIQFKKLDNTILISCYIKLVKNNKIANCLVEYIKEDNNTFIIDKINYYYE